MDKLFLTFPKDVAYLISRYLTIDDISNLYNAGRYLKLFVCRYYLKDGCLMKLKINGSNNVGRFISQFPTSDDVTVNCNFGIYNAHFNCYTRYLSHSINMRKSMFDNYWCAIPITGISFRRLEIQKLDKNADELELSININDLSSIKAVLRKSKLDIIIIERLYPLRNYEIPYKCIINATAVLSDKEWNIDYDFKPEQFRYLFSDVICSRHSAVKLSGDEIGLQIINGYIGKDDIFGTFSDSRIIIFGNPEMNTNNYIVAKCDNFKDISYRFKPYADTINFRYNGSHVVITNRDDNIGFSLIIIKQM